VSSSAWIILALLPTATAVAAPRRMAIVAGNNFGAPGEPELRYAQRDARRVAETLRELGSVAQRDLVLLLDQDAAALRRALDEVDRNAAAEPTVLIVYYSGHADGNGLHLGSSTLPWAELRQRLEGSRAQLRVALVDACQSGALTREKGFGLGPPLPPPPDAESRGTALLVASGSAESAQESASLGSSFFTHFLVSGLRGAADSDGDRRVTLAEAHAYTSLHTRQATSAWAVNVQHPTYHFDISGRGDIVLTDLREGGAELRLDASVSGHVVITERGSPLVVVESDEPAGTTLSFALPKGHYLVHVRKPNAVHLAEISLPWGGSITLGAHNFVARSYQEVAQKGAFIRLRRQRLWVSGAVASGVLDGIDAAGWVRLGYGVTLGPVELAGRLSYSRSAFHAVDTNLVANVLSAALLVTWERPLRRLDLRLSLIGEGQSWWESVARAGRRQAAVFGGGVGAGLRIPLWGRLFAETELDLMVYFPNVEDRGTQARASVLADAGLGVIF
jgi:hypothetical protein